MNQKIKFSDYINRSKMVKPMGTKDTITKDYMADNRIFADVFNHLLYKEKNIIDSDSLQPLDTTALCNASQKHGL